MGPNNPRHFFHVGDGADKVAAALKGNPDIDVNWVNEDDNNTTALHWASQYGQVEIVKVLLAHPGINVNVRDIDGRTPLQIACENGLESVVQVARVLLLDPRVDARSKISTGILHCGQSSMEGVLECLSCSWPAAKTWETST